MSNYTVDYFIQKFEAIPDELWCVGEFVDVGGRCCAAGHCGARLNGGNSNKPEYMAIQKALGFHIYDINDGKLSTYPQPTPRARILAALRDVKARAVAK
jgi:hypothetical protein